MFKWSYFRDPRLTSDSSFACLLQMDPAEERRDTKRHQENCNMLGYVADSEYGIPRRCPCGGRIIDEVCGKEEYDTHPGKRFFSCINYEVRDTSTDAYIGVQEEIERLRKRVEEADEAQVKRLSLLLDHLTVAFITSPRDG
ncbi:hypothetical protein Bca52824_085684 [Brassica carinata]|uniref:Zinc finger GRF-type domain-containing protein n=1 Tax=Brassica carinata TaxID=52824 RepID=A0A8X7P6F3_BRACI|nr:hypothetical protein Bca52824_085684 [Brassica carinata]